MRGRRANSRSFRGAWHWFLFSRANDWAEEEAQLSAYLTVSLSCIWLILIRQSLCLNSLLKKNVSPSSTSRPLKIKRNEVRTTSKIKKNEFKMSPGKFGVFLTLSVQDKPFHPKEWLASNFSFNKVAECSFVITTKSLHSLTPKGDWHLISPYNITPESKITVTRIKETITP